MDHHTLRELLHAGARAHPPARDVGATERGLPPDYLAVLRIANGFTTLRPRFTLYSYEEATARRTAEWVGGYGSLIEGFMSIGEDIFGDQYGYLTRPDAAPVLARFLCEGGQIEACLPRLLPDFLERQILGPSPAGLDFGLAAAAWQLGLQPTEQEHLAFKVPLIAGGAYTVDNLGVESAALHLGLLGQLSVQVRGLSDGQPIRFDAQ